MKKFINLALLSMALLFTKPAAIAAESLRATGDLNSDPEHSHDMERDLRHKIKNQKSNSKGGEGTNVLSAGPQQGFLPVQIEPIPYENCVPAPPGVVNSKKGGKKGGSMKGKGKSGKNGRRNRRRSKGRIVEGTEPELPGVRALRHSNTRRNNPNTGNPKNRNQMKMNARPLPYCPNTAPTFFPTFFPSYTPFPTSTPIPTVTPIPTSTPFPTIGGGNGGAFFPPPGPTPSSASPVPAITPTTPGATLSPVATGEFAPEPVVVPAGAQNISVQSTLEYGFFAGTQVRQPTRAEYNGLLNETSKFYEMVVKAAYPSLVGFQASFVGQQFRPTNADLPVLVQFDANAFFPLGQPNVPTQADIYKTLQNANYQDYIMNYVWKSNPPGTIFANVQRAAYNARVNPATLQGAR